MLNTDSSVDRMMNPYVSLGLQRNPFIAADEVGVSDDVWIDRGYSEAPAIQAKQLVQVMGPKGFGKTSHLKHWQSQTGGTYCYYPPGLSRFKVPPVNPIVYWDEADRIPRFLLIAALARAAATRATIIVGTHADLGRWGRLWGLSVKTIHLAPLDGQTLMVWTRLQIEAVRCPHLDCQLVLTQKKAADIVALAQGSWRYATDYLHIWAADMARAKAND